MKTTSTLPMKTAGTNHLIERTYRESGAFQWARETLVNALEAGATRVAYDIEWQAVASKGVYRRVIADNGKGMSATQLVEFFNTFGGGGKPIGGIHENFGVGSKTSLLPWNTHGLVVISWVDGKPGMVWVRKDKTSKEYGLRQFKAGGGDDATLESVVEPFKDEWSGCDWAAVKPDFIQDHGTVIVLLGNTTNTDTILGDPEHNEAELKGLAAYLNRRIFEIPAGVEISVSEMRTSDRNKWPKAPDDGGDNRSNKRTIKGALHYISYPSETFNKGRLSDHGDMALRDGTKLHWYLWSGDRPGVHSYAANQGYIGALYKNELYDVTAHASTYRTFGVIDASVRQRLWLIAEPPPYDEVTKRGVYPRTDRNALLLRGGPEAGAPLPIANWGAEFADNMPDPIRQAIRDAYAAQAKETEADESWKERYAERFGARWRVTKRQVSSKGDSSVDPTQIGSEPLVRAAKDTEVINPREPRMGVVRSGTSGSITTGVGDGNAKAKETKLGAGIPSYKFVTQDDLEPGMLAAWAPHYPEHPEGVVLINASHPILAQQVMYWREQYADHHAEMVDQAVLQVYGQVAVAKVAHSEKMKGILPSEVVENLLRSEESLTMSLLGLVAEEALIAQKLGGTLGKRKQ